jgi:proteasome component ECM29
MDIAHHQLALNTRRGAAFGFAGIAKLAGADLSAHVGALVPKLYRCAPAPAAAAGNVPSKAVGWWPGE